MTSQKPLLLFLQPETCDLAFSVKGGECLKAFPMLSKQKSQVDNLAFD
ncbi:hypothetical protein [Thalassotalea litorea]|nr:hypothetical protein [Thalassotalea litorea]